MYNKNMLIRNAEKKDIQVLSHLAMAVADHHHALDSYYKPASAYEDFNREVLAWLEDADTLLLVADDEGRVIGYGRFAVEDAPAYAAVQQIGVVYDVYVDPAARRKGIATLLTREALEWFNTKLIKHIELSVASGNADAVAFWKKLGFAPYKTRMRLDK